MIYAPDPLGYHVAHSIFFQVLGDHGFIGLAIFLVMLVCAWRTGTRVIRFCGKSVELKWASDLARMAQVCMIGFIVSGTFLSLAYFDLLYDFIVLLVVMEKFLMLRRDRAGQPIAYVPMASLPAPRPRKGMVAAFKRILL